ncbi:Uncharacterized protein OS=Solibacter usitatus (strain Ellin6076) GN=Acid_5039 PE=4 SV=1: PSCyt2: PSD1 [Gemmataceae bacterium]|nr:Uncharacterized protein OS=Solibacter usitatus (strain Ellin6076) GN=Acid_5039 PE=4 SV=1: PSCyt2: PSD1 [Gemmataceae bacterium]VTU01791.1 Uncharacterized protein OS=Solibacter usitatus (strain Ellin6076) GN=Acid_5039 PE=4 SV=1: PSCyt2: PSD1 [Gemmataceae bacterium]
MTRTALAALAVTAALAGRSHAAPPAAPAPAAPSFRLDVMPVFFRAGCNSGGCHGASRGKDGFRLSLFGYDPAGDYFRLTQQMVGRRVNVAAPEQSLLLLKSIGAVPHTGGTLFDAKSPYYKTLLKWIDAGAPDDAGTVPEVVGIALDPPKLVFDAGPGKQPLRVTAAYSDGTSRDVTALSLFQTNNKSVADVGADGVVTAGNRGDTNVFARFSRFTVGAEAIVLPKAADFAWPAVTANNYIDELVHAKLKKLLIVPSELCTDEEFLRRAHLDLVGLPPTPAEFGAFVADNSPDKRVKLVDALLARDEFADLWAAKWGEWLKINGVNNSLFGTDNKAAEIYYHWVRDQLRKNVPWDRFVRDQVTATGSNMLEPEVNFYTMLNANRADPTALAQDVAQVLLGIRVQCAECHNHPFDRWTMDDYYGFVSLFTGTKIKYGSEPREVFVYRDAAAKPAKHALDGRLVPPRVLGGAAAVPSGRDPRAAFAAWLTAPGNDLFRRNLANRVWAHFFGTGIVDPVDDFRVSNPPSNPELLDELGKRFAAHGYDVKKLVRDICTSRTYQLSSAPNATNRGDDRQFSKAAVRRLRADVMLDTLSAATGVETEFKNYPRGHRAVQVPDGGHKYGSYFLPTFGLATRETACACETKAEATFAQALHLCNGETVEKKLAASPVIPGLLKAGARPEAVIEELYVRALCRRPTAAELKTLLPLVADRPADRAAYDDIFWGLLNSTEFGVNH